MSLFVDGTEAGGIVHCFMMKTGRLYEARSMEEEKVKIILLTNLWTTPVIPNLRWIIPFQLSQTVWPIGLIMSGFGDLNIKENVEC